MKTIVIIQARMGSSRLPGKVLKPLGASTILDYVVFRCKQIKHIDAVIVATSTLTQDDAIETWCRENETLFYRGSEDDVLERYYKCAQLYNPDYIMRVTSDCPFLDYELAQTAIELMYEKPADIVVNEKQDHMVRGLSAELISYSALKHIYEVSTEHRHREHVTYYAYEYADQFSKEVLNTPAYLLHSGLRLTVDTIEDYQLCQLVTKKLGNSKMIPAAKYTDYLAQHPEIAKINSHIEQKPVV